MSAAVEIAIAVFAALRGNRAGAFAAVVGALVLGVLAVIFGSEERHNDWRS
jgi:hypothetical protein